MDKFLEKYSRSGECPFGCGVHYADGKCMPAHVYSETEQTDEHLLAAARVGLFARDFTRLSISKTDVLKEEAGTGDFEGHAHDDPVDVSIFAGAPPGNTSDDSKGVAVMAEHNALLRQRDRPGLDSGR
jgi:hypothetical protein